MGSELEDFLYRLASDDALLSRYRADPGTVVAQSPLGPEAAHALLTGDVGYLRKAVPRPAPLIWVDVPR